MSLVKFLFPIVDSGYFFDFELLEVTKVKSPEGVLLNIRFSLRNIHPFKYQIPIKISHRVYPDCDQEISPSSYKGLLIRSDRVQDLQTGNMMYGYGDDHHVLFEPGEKKEFLILFEPSPADFRTFDIDFFMKPEDDDYGLYMLRYDFQGGQFIHRYCIRKYS